MIPVNRAKRTAGFALPLLSIKTGEGPCGEFPDIAAAARLARSWDMEIVQLLPVNDTGRQPSPYSALSAFALNPVYLRVGALPDIERGMRSGKREEAAAASFALEKARELTKNFSASAKVPYADILERKTAILESLWESVREGEQGAKVLDEIEAWAARRSWAKPYACFAELKRRSGGAAWWDWPVYGQPGENDIAHLWNSEEYGAAARFWIWLQIRAEEQFSAACADARRQGVDVMGDIPILMSADSADVWFDRKLFDTDMIAGAPPDMYARYGQNWGFPLYRWDKIEQEDFRFWKERLAAADMFYTLYRIDHVLGFFRIWAIGKKESDGFLGHFMPEFSISAGELAALGFDEGRVRWLSKPHVPESHIVKATAGFSDSFRGALEKKLFERIGREELYLFSRNIGGGSDIREAFRESAAQAGAEAPSEPEIRACRDLVDAWWRDRTLLEIEPDRFVSTWEYGATKAWASLGEEEKKSLAALIARKKSESMGLWETNGRRILKALSDSVDMRACAEDLGAVPPCVPAVLSELGIPGLRVLRWHREWDKEGAPYVPLAEYPELSVACTSVHDSSNLRQWWEEEADKRAVWALIKKSLSEGAAKAAGLSAPGEAPATLDPDAAFSLLAAFAAARSRMVVYPLQDLLAASARHREAKPVDERINVPGTMNESNWLYRMKPSLEALSADKDFAARMALISTLRKKPFA